MPFPRELWLDSKKRLGWAWRAPENHRLLRQSPPREGDGQTRRSRFGEEQMIAIFHEKEAEGRLVTYARGTASQTVRFIKGKPSTAAQRRWTPKRLMGLEERIVCSRSFSQATFDNTALTPIELPTALYQRWSLEFVSYRLSDGRRSRIPCLVESSAANACQLIG